MVSRRILPACVLLGMYPASLLWAQEAAKKLPLDRLPPEQRAKALAGLGALVLLGCLMIVLTWLGGRVARRYARSPRLSASPSSQEPTAWRNNSRSPGPTTPPNPNSP